MSLSTDQLTDLQGDLGITADEAVFTDDELNRLYARADSDYNTAVYLGYRQLLADANKFFDYTVGQASVKRSQVREHLFAMLKFWQEEARVAGDQVRMVGLNQVPTLHKDRPGSVSRRTQPWKDWDGWR